MTAPTSIHFLNVGQGDSTLAVDTTTTAALLIDCPNKAAAELVKQKLDELKVDSIAIAFVTHSHVDHFGAVFASMTGRDVGELRFNLAIPKNEQKQKLKAFLLKVTELQEAGTNVERINAGDVHEVGAITCKVLAPSHAGLIHGILKNDSNESCAVLRLDAHERSALVSSDMTKDVWDKLVADCTEDLTVDIVRLPHHGAEFLGTAVPDDYAEVAEVCGADWYVISVGTNTYGHPSPNVIKGVVSTERPVLCTHPSDEAIAAGADTESGSVVAVIDPVHSPATLTVIREEPK